MNEILDEINAELEQFEGENILQAQVAYYRAALAEIAKKEGPYSRNRLTHAENVIGSMAAIAEDALAGTWEKPEEPTWMFED